MTERIKKQLSLCPTINYQLANCSNCDHQAKAILKYQKLTTLLYKKIKRLQQKFGGFQKSQLSQQKEIQTNCQGINSLDENKKIKKCQVLQILEQNQAQKRMNQPISQINQLLQEAKMKLNEQCMPSSEQTSHKMQIKRQSKCSYDSNMLINDLTEEIMNLKSRFMHVRHCIYVLLKTSTLTEQTSSNKIVLNTILALSNIFEFSQGERQEMFVSKKVKHKRRLANNNKENIFVTIKQI